MKGSRGSAAYRAGFMPSTRAMWTALGLAGMFAVVVLVFGPSSIPVPKFLQRPQRPMPVALPQVDSHAVHTLLHAQAGALSRMPYEQAAETLLATALGDADEARDGLMDAVPAYGGVPAFLATNGTVPAAAAGDDDASYKTSAHEAAALFILACKRAWPAATPLHTGHLRPALRAAADHLVSRVSRQHGLFVFASDPAGADPSDATAAHRVRTLRHVQALAGLRAASVLLGEQRYAVTAETMLRALHKLYVPLPQLLTQAEGGGAPVILDASAGNGGTGGGVLLVDDGAGPLHVGVVLRSAATIAHTPGIAPMMPLRGLSSELPLTLLFLEPRDLPSTVVARIAAASLALASPLGIKMGRTAHTLEEALAGGGKNGGGHPSYVVSPLEQAVIAVGAAKHAREELLAVHRRNAAAVAAGAAGDEGAATTIDSTGAGSKKKRRGRQVPAEASQAPAVPVPGGSDPDVDADASEEEDEGDESWRTGAASGSGSVDDAESPQETRAVTGSLLELHEALVEAEERRRQEQQQQALQKRKAAQEGGDDATAAEAARDVADGSVVAIADPTRESTTLALLRTLLGVALRVTPLLRATSAEASARFALQRRWYAPAASGAASKPKAKGSHSSANDVSAGHYLVYPQYFVPVAATAAAAGAVVTPAGPADGRNPAPLVCPAAGIDGVFASGGSGSERCAGLRLRSAHATVEALATAPLVSSVPPTGAADSRAARRGQPRHGDEAAAEAALALDSGAGSSNGAIVLRYGALNAHASSSDSAGGASTAASGRQQHHGGSAEEPESLAEAFAKRKRSLVDTSAMAASGSGKSRRGRTGQAAAAGIDAHSGSTDDGAVLLVYPANGLPVVRLVGGAAQKQPRAGGSSGALTAGVEHVAIPVPLGAGAADSFQQPGGLNARAIVGRLRAGVAGVAGAVKSMRSRVAGGGATKPSGAGNEPRASAPSQALLLPVELVRGSGLSASLPTAVATRFFLRLADEAQEAAARLRELQQATPSNAQASSDAASRSGGARARVAAAWGKLKAWGRLVARRVVSPHTGPLRPLVPSIPAPVLDTAGSNGYVVAALRWGTGASVRGAGASADGFHTIADKPLDLDREESSLAPPPGAAADVAAASRQSPYEWLHVPRPTEVLISVLTVDDDGDDDTAEVQPPTAVPGEAKGNTARPAAAERIIPGPSISYGDVRGGLTTPVCAQFTWIDAVDRAAVLRGMAMDAQVAQSAASTEDSSASNGATSTNFDSADADARAAADAELKRLAAMMAPAPQDTQEPEAPAQARAGHAHAAGVDDGAARQLHHPHSRAEAEADVIRAADDAAYAQGLVGLDVARSRPEGAPRSELIAPGPGLPAQLRAEAEAEAEHEAEHATGAAAGLAPAPLDTHGPTAQGDASGEGDDVVDPDTGYVVRGGHRLSHAGAAGEAGDADDVSEDDHARHAPQPNAVPVPPPHRSEADEDVADEHDEEVAERMQRRAAQRAAVAEREAAEEEADEEEVDGNGGTEGRDEDDIAVHGTGGRAPPVQIALHDWYKRACPSGNGASAGANEPFARPWHNSCCAGEAMQALLHSTPKDGTVAVGRIPTFTCSGRRAVIDRADELVGDSDDAAISNLVAAADGVGTGASRQQPTRRVGRGPASHTETAAVDVSCAFVMDGFCDCLGDGADEPTSSACAPPTTAASFFRCPSGVLAVHRGELRPVPALTDDRKARAAVEYALAPAKALPAPLRDVAAVGYIPTSKVGDGVRDCVDGEDEA